MQTPENASRWPAARAVIPPSCSSMRCARAEPAARFVSGYLIQLKADQKSLDGPSGTETDFTDLHAAWCRSLPAAGWIGLDPTSGLLAGEGHIPSPAHPSRRARTAG